MKEKDELWFLEKWVGAVWGLSARLSSSPMTLVSFEVEGARRALGASGERGCWYWMGVQGRDLQETVGLLCRLSDFVPLPCTSTELEDGQFIQICGCTKNS